MTTTNRLLLLAVLLWLAAASLPAQSTGSAIGHWKGSLQTPSEEMIFEVDLARNSSGDFTGTLDQPSENLKGLPLGDIAVDGQTVRFQIKGTPGERAFKGNLAADGKSISGGYTQGGYSMPFTMTLTGDPIIEAPIKNAPLAKELEGVWNGTMAANGRHLRAVLTLSNQPDGTASGSIVTMDDGLEIPIAAITQKASGLTLDLKAVGAFYTGALNADRTELAGTYTQGSLVLPLIFRRSTETDGDK